MIDENKVVENQNTTEGWNESNPETNVNTNTEQMVVDKSTLDSILQRMDKLEAENEELKKGQMNVFTEWKKFYEWPRKFCYKMWGWVPVLSYKSFRKDLTKDLVYQNQYGAWVSNHYLKLTLANDKSVEVEVNEFNKHYTLSEKMFAEKATDNRGNVLGYEFDTEEWWKIIVATNMLNE